MSARSIFPDLQIDTRPIVIGVVHLQPLPAAPRYGGDVSAVVDAALRDAEALVEGGADALLLENFGDAPYYPRRAPACVVAQMTAVAVRLTSRFDAPLGVNVLRNDGLGALATAHAAGGKFIRVNVLCGARLTDQGLIEGIAHDLLRRRRELGAEEIKILADVDVKHSAPLAMRPIQDEVADLLQRGGADALIVTGDATGKPVDAIQLQQVNDAAGDAPVFVGSGATIESAAEMRRAADGFIVGSGFKHDGRIGNPVDVQRVKSFIRQLR